MRIIKLNYIWSVKNHIKIISLIFLTAIYCFAIGAAANQSVNYSNISNDTIPSQEKVALDVSAKLFFHTSESESLVSSYEELPSLGFKNPFAGFLAANTPSERLIVNQLHKYTSYSKNILVNYRKSDIIFPSHYFW